VVLMRTVAEAMVAPVAVAPGTTLQEAAAAMLAERAQAAVIVDAGGRARGLLTADDVARALAEGRDPAATPVHGVAREAPVVRAEDPLVDAHRLMRVSGHKVVAVVGAHREPVGLLMDAEA
jgi:CBS domain-containing protein